VARVGDRQAHGGDMVRAAADLVTSVGRFSLAMGLLAARQATRLVSAPSAQAAASLDEVTQAASARLTGLARTTFAVGANLQSGLVNAAFDVAGLGPAGQAPTGATSGLSMSLGTSAARRATGVRTVASGALDRAVPQAELLRRLFEHHTDALARGPDPERTVAGLWKSEGLATTIAKHLLPENSLSDAALPRHLLPIAHVGFGSGSAELHMFDAAQLHAVFRERCANQWRDFAYEGIGAILRAYEPGFFKLMSGTLGLIPLDARDGPNPARFFAGYLAQFPADIQRLIAHGYGRLAAFSNLDVYKAIRFATTLPPERVEPVVHGAAFAFAMMNSMELPLLLRESAVPFEPAVRAAFQNGLIYGLVFMDWYAPGVLAAWQPAGSLEAELVAHARREIAAATDRGVLPAFRLAHPRT
jgi:hypothetical protein